MDEASKGKNVDENQHHIPQLPPWELVTSYDKALPRYTSYPTAPSWAPQNASCMQSALEIAGKLGKALSMYVHIPFCEHMCLFCGCNVIVTRDEQKVSRYLEALKGELQLIRDAVGPVALEQLHFGGGTPTHLSPSALADLIDTIFSHFTPCKNGEFSMEVNPAVTSREHLRVIRDHGINRLSMGVQDFSSQVQTNIERHQSPQMSHATFQAGRELGFSSINLDLMYGLPSQSLADVAHSASEVLKLGADRIALFGYAHVPWIKPHQRKLEIHGIHTAKQRWDMFCAARSVFLQGGYVPIGMDHFARPDDELSLALAAGKLNRNFQGYTVLDATHLIGVGVSSISDVGGAFFQNHPRLGDYLKATESGTLATCKGLERTQEDNLRKEVINHIMCRMVCRFDDIAKKFEVDPPTHFAKELTRLEPMVRDGLVTWDAVGIQVTEQGRPLVRNIAAVFDAYLETLNDDKPRFSRAV